MAAQGRPALSKPFLLAALLLAALGSLPTVAQPIGQPGGPPPAEPTVLELTESARREVPQDELVATLLAHAETPEPAAAQNTVNRMMKAALDTARRVPGVRESSGTYMVSQQHREGEPPLWVAQQQLNLTSDDGPALLGLVGELQGAGLAIQDLHWTLAANTRRGIERQLLSEALEALSRTARTAADGLGLRVLGWRRISLTPNEPIPPPYRARAAMAAPSPEMAPPVAAAGLSEVVVTVSAEALLSSGR